MKFVLISWRAVRGGYAGLGWTDGCNLGNDDQIAVVDFAFQIEVLSSPRDSDLVHQQHIGRHSTPFSREEYAYGRSTSPLTMIVHGAYPRDAMLLYVLKDSHAWSIAMPMTLCPLPWFSPRSLQARTADSRPAASDMCAPAGRGMAGRVGVVPTTTVCKYAKDDELIWGGRARLDQARRG